MKEDFDLVRNANHGEVKARDQFFSEGRVKKVRITSNVGSQQVKRPISFVKSAAFEFLDFL